MAAQAHADGELPHPHAESETLRLTSLYAGRGLVVHDVRCRPHDFGTSAEECSHLHQVVLPRRGVFQRSLRGKNVLADANQLLFFSRDEPYRVAHPAGCGDDCTALSFSDALLHDALVAHDPDWLARGGRGFRFDQALVDRGLVLTGERLRAAARAKHDALALEEMALALLDAALQCAYRSAPRTQAWPSRGRSLQREAAQRTALHLATHFAENHSLEEIGRAVHVSPFHLARLFRRELGTSIHQYRHQLRLREA
ncbi:MAG TPA: AraC family transcriptional regulator, partial [Polyangiales bacterium]